MSLPPISDWHGNQREATTGETARAEATAARVLAEVAEIRAAADQLAAGTPIEAAVADFLRVQATLLERTGGSLAGTRTMRPDEDTREWAGMLTTAARSALLIARAHTTGTRS